MFLHIFVYEIKYWLKNPTVYIYGLTAFLLGLLSMAGSVGVLGDISGSTARVANSSIAIYDLTSLFTKLALFIIPAIEGASVYRDFKGNAYRILFSYPIEKSGYLSAKFLSAFAVIMVVAWLFLVGCFSGALLPNANEHLILPFKLNLYTDIFIAFLLPNLVFFSVISFAVVLITRNIYAGFISVVIIIILREMALRLTAGADVSVFSLLLDPLGDTAVRFYTGVWTIQEQNVKEISLEKFILFNRILWSLASIALFFICFYHFSFSQHPAALKSAGKRTALSSNDKGAIVKVCLPPVLIETSFAARLRQAGLLAAKEYAAIVKTGAFISIVLAGSLFVYVLLSQMNAPYGVKVLPVTWVMLAFPVLFFSLLINFVTFLYAGVLTQRPETYNVMQLIDATVVPNWVLLFSKLLALIKIQMTLLAIVFFTGILVQLKSGYYYFEIGRYLFDLYGIHLVGFVIWAFAALLIQVVLDNSWFGLFILILIFFGVSELPLIGIEHCVYRFNQTPDPTFYLRYSALSGYSRSLGPYFIYKAYWFCFGLFLFCLCLLFWRRGVATPFPTRLSIALERFKKRLFAPTLCAMLIVISLGFAIYKEEKAVLKPLTPSQISNVYEAADKKYRKYQNMLQPRIVKVDVTMDIYPEQQKFSSTAQYMLVNQSASLIDTLIVNASMDAITRFNIDVPSANIWSDETACVTMLKLDKPMKPGDSLRLSCAVENIPNSFFYKHSLVENNGTYITSLIYPAIGYRSNVFQAHPEDTLALNNHYRSHDADYIDFKATIGTSGNQMAVAPGYLSRKWSKDGRNYFQYQSTSQITNDYAFISGDYAVAKDKWKNIEIEIYHDNRHAANIGYMINGIKATLDYCENNYGAYPHKQIKLIEYARSVGDFAQSFANTIPYSEIGFIMDIDKSGQRGVNLSFLGASHEMAHQWWGLTTIPADVKGAKMITESMAEYVSLKTLEKAYGKSKALEQVEKAMSTYLRSSMEDETEEFPLIYNTGNDKAHIPYQKGMLALNALSSFWGEENLNRTLKKYFNKTNRQTAPYTTSIEMLDYIKKDLPDSLQYMARDLFEDVIFYDNKLLDANIMQTHREQFEIEFSLDVRKIRKEKLDYSEADVNNDLVEIGFYSTDINPGNLPAYVRRIRVKKGQNVFRLAIAFKPDKIVIDPRFLLIDKNRSDNSIRL